MFDPPAPVARLGDHEIWPGTVLYDRSGHQYEFGAVLDESRWYVHPFVEQVTWDGETERYAADSAILLYTKDLYLEPPKPVLVEEIARAEERLQNIREQIRNADREFANFQHEEKARQERIRRHEQLARLDDWIQGKITHVVQTSSNDIRIRPIADFQEDSRYVRRGEAVLKLLTLFGTTNGDFNWRFGMHRDDSGGSWEVIPCGSFDEAIAEVQKMVGQYIEDWRETGGGIPSMSLFLAEKTAQRHELSFPDDATEALRLQRIASHQQSVDKARDQLASAVAKLDEVRNG